MSAKERLEGSVLNLYQVEVSKVLSSKTVGKRGVWVLSSKKPLIIITRESSLLHAKRTAVQVMEEKRLPADEYLLEVTLLQEPQTSGHCYPTITTRTYNVEL